MSTSEITSEVAKDSSFIIKNVAIPSAESLVAGLEPMASGGKSSSNNQEATLDMETGISDFSVDPLLRLKVHVQMLSEIRSRMQFMNREISYLLKL